MKARPKLRPDDLRYVLQKLPKKLVEVLTARGDFDRFFIAGGVIRSAVAKEVITDVDVFTDNEALAYSLANELVPAKAIFKTDNALSFNLQGRLVQVIYRWTFPTATDVIRHFDFTVCQAVIFLSEHKIWTTEIGDDFYYDLAAKRLVYTNPPLDTAEAGGSLLRMLKYRGKGYSPTLQSVAAIVARIASVDEKAVYAQLREVDPLMVIPGEPAEGADVEKNYL